MEAACNRSVLLQAPEVAAYFTPSSPRCFGKAGANGRSGWSPGRGLGSGTGQLCHAGTSGILRGPSPGPPAASLRCRDGHDGAGGREWLGTEGAPWPCAEVSSPARRETPTAARGARFSQGLLCQEERCAAPG